jgi:DNA-binding response OmpR family regulator
MPERRLLVIDDDKMIHTLMRGALDKHGYRVHSAFDSVQAPMVARQLKPDLIVLDILMPGGGGFEAFRRFQMLSTTAQIPILVYSTLAPEDVTAKIPIGASVGYLRKPASPEAILAAVKELLHEA